MPEMLALRETDPREVGAYRLLGRLGEGGQGVVFLAEGPTGSSAALKLLPPTTDPQVRSRFLKEVAAAQRVARFCTAQVLDAGIFERRPFIVSEYVSGPSLVEIVEQLGPRGGAALERIAVATLTALGAVHAAGMVHRDFKPANVLLGPDGPVVIDFGLAAVPGMTTVLSGEVTVGTPAFMAPEQLAGSRVTAAADMWSWAVAMVFAGTGELPFKGESLTAMAYAILHSEPSVGRLPEPLGSLVRRCLNKDPAGRPSARDVLGELVASGAQLSGPMPPKVSAPPADEPARVSAPAADEPPKVSALAADQETTSGSPRAPSGSPESNGDDLISSRGASGPGSARHGSRRIWSRRPAYVILAVIVLVAGIGALAFNLPWRGPGSEQPAGRNAQGLTAQAEAITWVLQQVSRATVVSCDPQICADLVSGGFPSAKLLTLGPTSNVPLGSALVVATAAVRAEFGIRLATVYAPAVIASFGSNNARIDIRLVYSGGAAQYSADEKTALSVREEAGAQLLANSQIAASASARAQLLRGDVDPRLPQLLAIMAERHPVSIVDFVDQSPGGGPASLLRSVDLATVVSTAHLTRAAYLDWIQSLIAANRAQYLPASGKQIALPTGQAVVRIGYGAPSPLS
jgi:serine/threonine protein kinase